jgi:hypothetical protein
MTREEAASQIRKLLATEESALILSNRLFTPNGLFNQIAHSAEERREVIKTDLWRDAMARMRELESREAGALDESTKVLSQHLPYGRYQIRLERADLN